MWSVICTVSDNKVIYSLVQGEAPEAEFTGSRRQCLAYRSFITLSRVYSETLTAKGFTQQSMFQVLCEELKSKFLTMSGFQILALIFLSAK
jgi:hypothetical protein